MVIIIVGAGLGLTAMPSFELVLSPPVRVLSLMFDMIADPGRVKATGAFCH